MNDLAGRFWARVQPGPGCWPWTGRCNDAGYGLIDVTEGVGVNMPRLAHRVAYALTYGDPGELDVLHSCDNPPCVRPSHLFEGTQATNMADALAKGRHVHPVMPGELNPNAKLTEGVVREIRALYASGEWTQHALAAHLGLTRSVVADVVVGRRWAHVV